MSGEQDWTGTQACPYWGPPAYTGPLPAGEVQVWRFVLDPGDETLRARPHVPAEWLTVAQLSLLEVWSVALAPDERQRALSFHFQRDRWRFVLRRLALRAVLSAYTGLDPRSIRYEVSPYGRPVLSYTASGGAEPVPGTLLQFSTANSDGQALVACALGRAVGVDLERMRPDIRATDIAGRFFSAREQVELNRLPPERYMEGFFYTWVCKESYIKALGQGLSLPLDAFDVVVDPAQPAALLETGRHVGPPLLSSGANHWLMMRLDPGAGFAGALCMERSAGDALAGHPVVSLFSPADIFDWLASHL